MAQHVQCVLALAPHGFVCECKVRKYSGVIGDLEDAVDREVRGSVSRDHTHDREVVRWSPLERQWWHCGHGW